MRLRFTSYLIFVFSIVPLWLTAQTNTRITGKVVDAATREALPFVNIQIKGTSTGGQTDFDGNYRLMPTVQGDSIVFSYIGYKRKALPIKNGVTQEINVELESAAAELPTVEITPGENPAHRILRQVWAHKPENDREKLDAYQYEAYNKIEFDLNNIPDEFKQRKVLKPVKFIFDYIDSTNANEKPHLPVFFTETLSDFYYKRHDPKMKKEVIKGSKVSGIEDASISQFTGQMYIDVNIYDNNILVFDKNFVSPISNNGLFYYRYYLIDSTFIGNHRCYQIQFMPKRKQELLFKGNMWIADTSFAVRRLEMNICDDANINYINSFFVVQEYDNESGSWMLTKDRLVVDFAIRDKKMGVYGRKTSSYRNIVINQPKDDEFYSKTENIIVQQGAEKRDSSFWAEARHDSLTATEKNIYAMVDTIQHLPVYKTWEDIVIVLASGYKVWKFFEYGPYYNTLSFNKIEGTRLRFGGRTSNSFSRWVELSGYAAYGFKDDAFKYSAAVKTYITKKPRQLTGINYKNDYELLGQSEYAFTSDNLFATLFRRTPLSNMTHVEEYQWWYEREWFNGFNTKLFFVNRNMYPLADGAYMFARSDGSLDYKPGITTSEVRLQIRFAWDEKYIENVFSRVSVSSKWPIVKLQATAGLKGVFNSDYNYQKLNINIDDRFRVQPLGYTNYVIDAGKIWGRVPFPLMVLHPGNETYVYDWASFNMMNYYEFASDMYAALHVFHHFEGFFFNKVPLLRKLKWREVATAKILIGSASTANRNELLFPTTLHALTRGPYMEAGAGVENIFKFFRVDAFWRLSYLDNPNISRFGIRVSLQLLF